MEIMGALRVLGMGASGLLMAEGVAGVRTGGEAVSVGELPSIEVIPRDGATWYGCMTADVIKDHKRHRLRLCV